MDTLNKAIALAVEVHTGVLDKAGAPYILHPIRVLAAVSKVTDDEDVLAAAVLHDAIEDGPPGTGRRILDAIGPRVWKLVNIVTHDADETYAEYIDRIVERTDYPGAAHIKRADAWDNLRRCGEGYESLRKRYAKALETLAG
jgi:(p)ppGpp synthase/HD superfamily hydrolase